MSSSTESGILNCLDGFTKLVAMILSFGSSYNPTPARLKSENLQNSLNQAKTIVADVNSAYSANKNAIAARKAAFISLSKLFTRVVNAFTITDADANLKANVKSVAAKMHSSSKKSSASEADNGNSPDTGQSHSSAQTGYINKVGHLRRIIALMQTEPSYQPAETDLTIASLTTFADELEQLNLTVIETENKLASVRDQRDDIFNNKITGLKTIGQEVKRYVKSAYGTDSSEAQNILPIKLS